jgi:signal transduction histidine kinase
MFRSLRFRMAASHALVLAVILVVLGGIGQALLARSLDHGVTSSLRDAAAQEVDHLRETGTPQQPQDSEIPSRSAIRVGVFLPGAQGSGNRDSLPSWLAPHHSEVVDVTARGERVRLVTLPAIKDGRLLATVVAGRSLLPEQSLIHRVRLLLLFGGLAAVAASLLAGWWLAGRAVHPVRRAYEAQASFAADASHELRTPLTYLRQAVEVMAERDPALGAEALSEIDYLSGVTQRLLLLARADRRVLELERKPTDLGELCRSAARRAGEVHGVRLDVGSAEGSRNGSLRAMADPVAAEAALDAVLENVAVHGGGAAKVEWFEDGDRVVVQVADQGPGIPPELADSAFERFTRADPSRTRDSGGAGLGLPLARSLIQAQAGSISLGPTPGGGLTVTISLPEA